MLFPNFEADDMVIDDLKIHFVRGGNGPGLLLLHGNPQTHVMWHKVASALSEHFTVVAADLRGQGDSGKPRDAGDHTTYSKEVMARDQAELMSRLGFERFFLAGHDRGARVAYRMAMDYPDRVAKVAFLDIVPTLEQYERTSREFALLYWVNFFYAQPPDLPERLIGADPALFVKTNLFDFADDDRQFFDDEAVAEYIRCFSNSDTIHAACEDYRASFSVDQEHDAANRHRKIECPVHVLWGKRAVMERCFDVMEVWRKKADLLSGRALDASHYLAEEQPEATARELVEFFR